MPLWFSPVIGPAGLGSAFLDGPLESQGAIPRPSDGQKTGDWCGVRHWIPLPTLCVLKLHYQARIVALLTELPPQNDSHLNFLRAAVHAGEPNAVALRIPQFELGIIHELMLDLAQVLDQPTVLL